MDSPFGHSTYAWDALEHMKQWDDLEAVVAEGRSYTYREFREGVLAMANALWIHGIRPGQTLGVYVFNPIEALYLQLGAHMMGARTAWTAITAPLRFRTEFVRLAGIDAFVYDAGKAREWGAEMAQLAAPLPIMCFGAGVGPDLTAVPAPDTLPFDPTSITTEPSSMFQTGGTTGLPKLVHHRHDTFRRIRAMADFYRESGAPRLRHLLPHGTWHISAQTAAFMTLFSGGTLFLWRASRWATGSSWSSPSV